MHQKYEIVKIRQNEVFITKVPFIEMNHLIKIHSKWILKEIFYGGYLNFLIFDLKNYVQTGWGHDYTDRQMFWQKCLFYLDVCNKVYYW